MQIGVPTKSQIIALALTGVIATGCSGMNTRQQRALSGGAIGAAGGAAIGLLTGSTLTGALVGGALGTGGGLLYHETQRNK